MSGMEKMPPESALRPSMTRRLMRRAVGRGEITLQAVPGMLEDYVTMCDGTFAAMGVQFSAEDLAHLREVLAGQLALAYDASPRSNIVISYESPVGLTASYNVKAQWFTVGEAYYNWVGTR